MKLNNKQQEKLISKLNQFWKNQICDICATSDWMVDDIIFELREFHGSKTVLGSGAIKPLITLTCTGCGNIKFMNAIQLGLVDPENPDGEIKEERQDE